MTNCALIKLSEKIVVNDFYRISCLFQSALSMFFQESTVQVCRTCNGNHANGNYSVSRPPYWWHHKTLAIELFILIIYYDRIFSATFFHVNLMDISVSFAFSCKLDLAKSAVSVSLLTYFRQVTFWVDGNSKGIRTRLFGNKNTRTINAQLNLCAFAVEITLHITVWWNKYCMWKTFIPVFWWCQINIL